MYLAWRYGGEDPYRLYRGLDMFYVPVDRPGDEPRPPAFPLRVKAFIYACAQQAQDDDIRLHGGKPASDKGKMALKQRARPEWVQ